MLCSGFLNQLSETRVENFVHGRKDGFHLLVVLAVASKALMVSWFFVRNSSASMRIS